MCASLRLPTNSLPTNYKALELGAWKEGRLLDSVPKGNWWGIFGDSGQWADPVAHKRSGCGKGGVSVRCAEAVDCCDGDEHKHFGYELGFKLWLRRLRQSAVKDANGGQCAVAERDGGWGYEPDQQRRLQL